MEPDVDVVVVGAGLAGLMAADTLMSAGCSVVVLEARNRVGGRLQDHEIGDGKIVELGGQWIGPTQCRLAALARALQIDTFPTYDQGEHLLHLGNRYRRFEGEIPRLGLLTLADLAQAQWRFERMAAQIRPECPWNASHAYDWDGHTFETWLKRNVLTRDARSLLHLFTSSVFSMEPRDVSLLHALFYTRSGGGIDSLVKTAGGAQQERFVGGAQTVALRLAARLGERLQTDMPVRRIAQKDDQVRVTTDAASFTSRRVIVAIPPTLAGRIIYDPILPGHRDQLTQRAPQGSVIKCMALYPTPFWREAGLSGQARSDTGPVKFTFDNSPPDGSPGVLLGFLEGADARRYGQVEPEERRQAVLDNFTQYFGPEAAFPMDYIEKDWAQEEWTRGCYVAHFGPGVWTQYGPALRAPIGRIHWAGTETATIWNGYMEGALESGERAAAEALALLD